MKFPGATPLRKNDSRSHTTSSRCAIFSHGRRSSKSGCYSRGGASILLPGLDALLLNRVQHEAAASGRSRSGKYSATDPGSGFPARSADPRKPSSMATESGVSATCSGYNISPRITRRSSTAGSVRTGMAQPARTAAATNKNAILDAIMVPLPVPCRSDRG